MNTWKTTAAALGAAALALMVSTGASAQTAEFAAAGSSALFGTLRSAAQVTIPNAATYSENNVGFVIDPSLPNAPEQGNLFVVYSTTLPRRVAFDISVDSTVGDRAYFNRDTVRITPGTAGGLGIGTSTGQIPQDVVDIVNRSVINVAATDIRPEDALVATATSFRLGYGPSNPIRDGGGNTAYPVVFNLSSRPFTVNPIGASPVLIFANTTTTNANTNVLGDGGGNLKPGAQNINRFTLGKIVDGTLFRTSDIDINAATPGQPLTTFIREPLSGTYNTFEYCIPRSLEVNSSQEAGVTSNPLNEAGVPLSTAAGMSDTVTDGGASSQGGRVRAIGTGALVRGVNSTSNALGYAFFSTSAFSSANAGNTRYLSVENAEPLNAVYTGGAYGGTPTFPNLVNGAYPIWSLLRLVFDPGNTVAPAYLANALNVNSGGNFAPANSLKVFRSHRAVVLNSTNNGGTTITANVNPNNGTAPGAAGPAAETGADAGGAIFLINNDRNFTADTGNQLTNFRQ